MKKAIPFLLAFTLLACKKELSGGEFAGTWEYVQYSGYPFTQNTLPPGNGNLIILSRNGEFRRMAHDTLLFKGTYSIVMKSDCNISGLRPSLKTSENDFDAGNFLSIDSTTGWLTISTSTCLQDAGATYYRRVE